MQKILIEKAKQLICEGKVTRVLGWKKGEFCYDVTPFMFTSTEELDPVFKKRRKNSRVLEAL